MTAHVTVNGKAAQTAWIGVPSIGPWIADVTFDSAVALTGRVTLLIGTTTFSGTVDDALSGAFQQGAKYRIVAGAAGWSRAIPSKHYHDDNGVRISEILSTTAAAAAEVLAGVPTGRMAVDWVRQAGPAARTLRALGPAWWVDYAGVTQLAPRAPSTPKGYEILSFNPGSNVADISADDVSAIQVGAVLTTRLAKPLTVRELEIKIEKDTARFHVWGTT